MKKTIVLFVLAIVLAVTAVIYCVNYGQPNVYSGSDLNLKLHHYNTLVIENAETVNIEAASSSFYAMHQGESVLIGEVTKAPVGWSSGSYFATPSTVINAGYWTIDSGDYSARLTSDSDMKVTVGKTTSDIISATLGTVLLGIYIWIMVWLLWYR